MNKKNFAILAAALSPTLALAQDGTAMSPQTAAFWAAGLCMGLAAAVGCYSQSRAAAAALEGITRNPASSKSVFTPLLLSMALMESLVLFAFVIAIILGGK